MKYNNLDMSITPPAGFAELVRRVEALRCREGRAFVAIDGRCGSGKSTLAALLAARFDCTLVHADDFFLRPEQRTPARLAQPGGNFDRERFYAGLDERNTDFDAWRADTDLKLLERELKGKIRETLHP